MNGDLLIQNIAAHWVQAGVLAASALIALRLLKLNEPRARLAALHMTLAASVLLPLVQPWRSVEPALEVTPSAIVSTSTLIDPQETASGSIGATSYPDLSLVLLGVVIAGAGMRLLWLLYGIFRLGRFSRMALSVPAPAVAGEIEDDLAVSARYIQQTGVRGPWTFGWMRPAVALPAGFDSLAPAFQRAVICHELLHIKRRDVVVAFFEELAVAALWFHPWIWLLRARIRVAREQVVDARVVEILGNRDEYVRCLVNISGHDLAPHFSQAGAGMLRARELRARVDAIFEEAHMSSRHLAAATFALLMAIGATAYVAGAALPMRSQAPANLSIPQPQSLTQAPVTTAPIRLNPATNEPINLKFTDARLRDVLAFIGHATSVVFTGYEASFDEARSITIEGTIDTTSPLETLLDRLLTPNGLTYTVTGPRTVVIARNPLAEVRQAQAALERARRQINKVYPEYPQDALDRGIQGTVVVDITVNAAGDVTTAAVASGPRELHASAFKAALGLKYTPGSSTTAMKIGFHYTLSGSSWGVRIGDVGPNISPRPAMIQGASATSANPDSTGAYRIGGAIQPPKKIKDTPPVYPAAAQEARVQGVVILEARIDENGNVSDTRTLRSVPLLDQAAIDAVKQWQYTPTLMNGVAVPVIMTVTVNFSLRSQVQMRINMPDGTLVVLRVNANGGVGRTEHPAMGRFGFAPYLDKDPSVETVKVAIYEFDEAGSAPRTLGDVELTPGAGLVQSATTPSFGIELISVSR